MDARQYGGERKQPGHLHGCMLPRMQYSREARIHSVGPNFDHLRLFNIVNHYFLRLMRVHASMEHRVDRVDGVAREHASDVEVVHYYIYSFVSRHLFLHSLNTHTAHPLHFRPNTNNTTKHTFHNGYLQRQR
jgi:hypothetical protein